MTSEDAAKRYQELALKLSYLYHQIDDLHETAEFLTEQTHDNGDPEYALDKGLWWLGKAIATANTYADEYREDAYKLTHPGGGPSDNQGMAETDNGTAES